MLHLKKNIKEADSLIKGKDNETLGRGPTAQAGRSAFGSLAPAWWSASLTLAVGRRVKVGRCLERITVASQSAGEFQAQ